MRKIKKIIIWSILVCILFTGKIVYAGEFKIKPDSTISGHYGSTNSCQYYSDFCFTGSGLRFSIYYYDYDTNKEKTTKEGASYDLWSTKHSSSWSGAVYPSNSTTWKGAHYSSLGKSNDTIAIRRTRGNTWYDNGTDFEYGNDWHGPKLSSLKAKKASFNKDFNGYINSGTVMATNDFGPYWNGSTSTKALVSFINEYLANKIKDVNGVNTFFKTNIDSSKVDKYYIVIEPIYAILTQAGINGKKKHVYVGTASELSEIYNYTFYANPLKSTKKTNKDFVANILTSIPIGASELNTKKVINKKAYGVGVYKLSDFMTKTCLTECSKSDVKNKYLCAMSFCDGSSDREKCVKVCNIKDPGFTCSNKTPTKSLADTNCTDKTTGEAKTCTKGYTNTDVSKRIYYYTECTETNDVKFKGSLPTTITPGEGFSYNLNLTGKKVCTTKFDVEKFNYDYATADSTTRNKMEQLFRNYQSLNTIPNSYKYDMSSSKFTFKAKEVINKENKTSSDIVLEKIKNIDGDNSIKKASTQEDSGTYYTVKNSNYKDSKNSGKLVMGPYSNLYNKTYKNKTYISDMSGEYGLPGVCLNAKGKTYSPTYQASENKYVCIDENKKRKNNEGPYRKYYTNIKSTPSDNKTYVYINKAGSISSSVKNTCNYIVSDKNLDCMITKDSTHYLLHILSNQKIDYSKYKYNFSININSTNFGTIDGSSNIIAKKLLNSDSLSASEISKYGKVIYGRIVSASNVNNVLAKCEYNLDTGSGNACKELYKPNQHDEICKYCQDNYNTDKEKYPTAKACEQDCGTNKCRQIYQCTDTENIKEYCNSQYSDEKQRSMCINDCSCKNDYLYRPISLTNPFPNNRTAGSNWLGFETTINDGSENDTPEYVVKLTTADIRRINDSTNYINRQVNKTTKKKLDAYTDYIWYGRADQNGPYRSNFINNEFSGLFCIKRGVGSCDG